MVTRSRSSILALRWSAAGLCLASGLWLVAARQTKAAAMSGTVKSIAATARTVAASSGRLTVSTRVTGQTSAQRFTTVVAPRLMGPEGNRALILIHLVKSGGMVKKGEVVARIDPQALQDHIDDLMDTIRQADADVRKRESEQAVEWEALQQTLRVAQSELNKAKIDYAASEVRTTIDRELLKLNLDEAEAQLKEQQSDLASKKASQEAELRILTLTKERHVRHRNRHLKDVEKFTIHAPMDGLAVMQSTFRGGEFQQIQLGDQLSPGQLFMKVVDPKSMQVDAQVNQAESGRFRIGQMAKVTLDAFPGVSFPARLDSVGALAVGGWRQSFYIRNVPVRLKLLTSDPRLLPDLSAAADVALSATEQGTQVPINAVLVEDGHSVVYVKKADGFERRDVQLGARNDQTVIVKSGVQTGEEVAVEKPVAAET